MAEIASGSIDLKSLKVAGEANKYITAIDENGVKVHAANNINLNYTQITSEGMEVFKTNGATSNPSAISVAKFGQTSIIGRQDQSHIRIINNGLSILNSGITLFDLLLDENQQAKLQHEYDFSEIISLPDSEYYLKKYPVVTVKNTTFSTDVEFEELKNAIDSFTINGYMCYYDLDGRRTSFNVQFDVATTATKTIGQEYVLKPGHEEETPTAQNTVLITIYGRHVANSNSVTFYTDSNNELPSSIDLLLLYNLKCYKMTGLPILTLGLKDRSHVEIDYHSLKLIDQEGESYLHISDLRDAEGYVINNFIGDGSNTEFYISGSAQSAIVTVNGIEQTYEIDYTYIELGERYIISFSTAPSLNASIVVRYLPHFGSLSKSYTFGKRNVGNSEWSILGNYSFAEGYNIIASGMYSHAEGEGTTAYGSHSHAEGYQTGAWGKFSHAEGYSTSANTYCHAEGYGSNASGDYAHAEGYETVASGDFGAHAEGHGSEASNHSAHAEGMYTIASGSGSHAEGEGTEASGPHSHAQNFYTIASSDAQTAIGKGNIEDNNDSYSLIIGNGYYDDNDDLVRSNALTVDWNGNIMSQGMAGVIQMYAGSIAPPGWLICNGSLVSKTTYATLYAVIGDIYKRENDDTTGDYFRLPDLVGRMPIGVGTSETVNDPTTRALGAKAGSERVTLTVDQIPAHTHMFGYNWNNTSGSVAASWSMTVHSGNKAGNAQDATNGIFNTGGGQSHGNMPPYLAINFIIATGITA